jgi:hypothetical protein
MARILKLNYNLVQCNVIYHQFISEYPAWQISPYTFVFFIAKNYLFLIANGMRYRELHAAVDGLGRIINCSPYWSPSMAFLLAVRPQA